MTPIHIRIRELRLARGWSQAELAKRASVRQATVSKLESGTTRKLDLDVLERLGNAFGVDPALLITRVDKRRHKEVKRGQN